METVSGRVENLFKNCPKESGWNGWFFITDSGENIRCTMKQGSWVKPGMCITIEAEKVWSNFTCEFEYQVDTAEISTHNKAGLVSYLSSDDFPGVGRVIATKLFDVFGHQILTVIDNAPDDIKGAGFSDKIVTTLVNGRMKKSVGNLLKLLNLKPSMIDKVQNKYGRDALDIIKKNPYRLLRDFAGEYGFHFENVDKLALQLGEKPDSQRRIDEAVYYVISKQLQEGGHLCIDLSDSTQFNAIMTALVGKLSATIASTSVVYSAITNHEYLVVVPYDTDGYPHQFCYTSDSYLHETMAADYINSMRNARPLLAKSRDDILLEIEDFELMSGTQLDDIQKEAVITSLQNRVSIITGGPGCGKTTVVACVLFVWRRCHMPDPVLSAPTGLAAKRMRDAVLSNTCGYASEKIVVKTIARRLAEAKTKDDYHRHEPTLAVIDETSMVNMADAAGMLRLFSGCQVVFVGDADQLPAIDPGDFFSDLCWLDIIPKQSLNICYRAVNAKVIIDNAHKIRDGKPVSQLDWSTPVFKMQKFQKSDMSAVNYMVNQYKSYIQSQYSYSDICILSPMRRGTMGVENLNCILQEQLNPEFQHPKLAFTRQFGGLVATTNGVPIDDTEYIAHLEKGVINRTKLRVGDRVIQMKNRYEDALVNGDCGVIMAYHKPDNSKPYIELQLDDGRTLDIDQENFSELALAYAVTIHKAQGCEYHHVLISLPHCLLNYWGSQNGFTNRNLVYTAGTRAKSTVEFVGAEDLLQQCIDTRRPPRQSLFVYRVLDAC